MGKFPKYLGKNYNTYFVELTVPKDVRDVLGTRRFHKSLQTDSLSQAETRKWKYIERWKKLIEAARKPDWAGKVDAVLQGDTDDNLAVWDQITDISEGNINHPAVIGYKEATGQIVRLDRFYEGWSSSLKQSTLKAYSNAVQEFIKAFPFAHDITSTAVTEYFRGLTVGHASKQVYVSGVRSFCSYIDYECGTGLRDFVNPDLSREQKTYKKLSRAHWEDDEVVLLLQASNE